MGIEDQVLADATAARAGRRHRVLHRRSPGEEIGRIHTWGTSPTGKADYQLASPCLTVRHPADLPGADPGQQRDDARHPGPVLHRVPVAPTGRRRRRRATVRDRLTGQSLHDPRQVPDRRRRRPLQGRRRHRPAVSRAQMDIAGSMNITFKADIARYVGHRPSVLYWVHPAGLQRRRHRRRPGAHGPAVERVADRLGLRHQPASRRSSTRRRRPRSCATCSACPTSTWRSPAPSLWGNNEMYATHLQSRAGVLRRRRDPPAPAEQRARLQHLGPGLLQPGLEARRGAATARPAPALLDTYSAERAPVAEQIVKRANKSSREFGQFFEALGPARRRRPRRRWRPRSRSARPTPRAARAKRAALVAAMELKNYEFNAHGVELGQFYESAAVVSDGSTPPSADPRPRAVLPSRRPCRARTCRTPGSATTRDKVSTLDLAPYTQFTLITGIAGEAWASAADEGRRTNSASRCRPSSSARAARSPTSTTTGRGSREVDEDGVLLVRPDKHIGWRAMSLPADPEDALRDRADRASWAGR